MTASPDLPDLILAALRRHQPAGTAPVLLACSGGIDSQVLMHAASLTWPAEALVVAHVHHGLQPEADAWLDFSRDSAERLGLAFLSRHLPQLPERLEGGVEAWARQQRYRALAAMAAEAGATHVLTAHHANDQLETHQLRFLRGAGPLGLGAMRRDAQMPGDPRRLLLRPFLGVARQQIVKFAGEHGIDWVDDPSNQDMRYARNRIRREVAQALLRDPAGVQRGLDVIGGFQAQADLARRQAERDLAACRLVLAQADENLGTRTAYRGETPTLADLEADASLSQASLARLPADRAAEVLRLWLERAGLRMPSRAKLAEICRQLIASSSAHARLRHDGIWLLRYRDRIDSVTRLPEALTPTWFRWSGEPLLDVAGHRFLFHRLAPDADSGPGIDAGRLAASELMMDRARGTDRLLLGGGGRHRSWKNLCQERGIPPWMRSALPVLRLGEELLLAAPFGINRGAEVPGGTTKASGTPQVVVEWLARADWGRWL